MESFSTVPGAFFAAALVGVAAVGSWTDVTQRRIPNWLCGINLAVGLAYAWFANGGTDGGWPPAGFAVLHAIIALLLTMALFAVGAIGAGDAKFYTSMAAWLPISQGITLLVAVAVAGLALLIVFALTRLRGRASRKPSANSHFDKLPYGVAIGVGGLAAVLAA